MPSQFVVLDESKSEKHPILSVGGIVVRGDDIPEIERAWAAMKRASNLADRHVKYSMTWPDPAVRIHFMEQIGAPPLRAVAALLEDFRPDQMMDKRETRSEAYIHVEAFGYVLQRLPESIYRDETCSPNLVLFDDRDDIGKFITAYADLRPRGWRFGSRKVPSLASIGFVSGLSVTRDGALNEIADMTISCITRWAGARAAAHRGKTVRDLADFDRDAAQIIGRFPCASSKSPACRRGYSLITHSRDRPQNVLRAHIDAWAREIDNPPDPPATVADDDIPS